jgi:hypothetical protein
MFTEALELKGVWGRPEKDTEKYSGSLSFSPSEGLSLELDERAEYQHVMWGILLHRPGDPSEAIKESR